MSAGTPLLAALALAAVIALILLARHGVASLPALLRARGSGARGGAGDLVLEQVMALDPRRRLLLVRCGARRVLLLTGGPQDMVVGWLDPGAAPHEAPAP